MLRRRIFFLLLFYFLLIPCLYYIRLKSQSQITEKNKSIFVEFLPCQKDEQVFIVESEIRIKDLFDIAKSRCRVRSPTEPVKRFANLEMLNEKVANGDRIYIDSEGVLHKSRMDGFKLSVLGLKMSLNEASEEELALISGIGKKLAHNIIEKRNEVGRFKNYEELLEVRGIGKKKLEALKESTFISASNPPCPPY